MEGDGGGVQNTEEFTTTPSRQPLQTALLGLDCYCWLVVVLSDKLLKCFAKHFLLLFQSLCAISLLN